MLDLIGKLVTVETPETVYAGRLVEIGETEVYLESEMGWMVIPTERVISVREKD